MSGWSDRPGSRPMLAVAVFYGVLTAAGLAWMALRGDRLLPTVFGPERSIWIALLAGLAAGVASDRLVEVFAAEASWARTLRREVWEIFRPWSRPRAVWLALVSGVGEEIFFRGALQPAVGLVPQALVFGLLHGGFAPSLRGWTWFALAMGFVLGFLAAWSGGLVAPIVAHVTVNGLQLLRLVRHPPSTLPGAIDGGGRM